MSERIDGQQEPNFSLVPGSSLRALRRQTASFHERPLPEHVVDGLCGELAALNKASQSMSLRLRILSAFERHALTASMPEELSLLSRAPLIVEWKLDATEPEQSGVSPVKRLFASTPDVLVAVAHLESVLASHGLGSRYIPRSESATVGIAQAVPSFIGACVFQLVGYPAAYDDSTPEGGAVYYERYGLSARPSGK
jgi:hypothetical protein